MVGVDKVDMVPIKILRIGNYYMMSTLSTVGINLL